VSQLITLDGVDPERPDLVGYKAANLARLLLAGFTVPPGVVLPAAELWAAAVRGGHQQDIDALAVAGATNSSRICSLLWQVDLGDLLSLPQSGALGEPLAVRSSSTLEDRSDGSSAGLMVSLLGVAPRECPAAVRTVWLSGFSPLLLTQRGRVPVDHLSVLIQPEVRAETAGVCFSRAPGHEDAMVLECTTGTAQHLLDGTTRGHRYVLDHDSGAVRQAPPDGPMRARDLTTLHQQVMAVEDLYGHPVDVEFAVEQSTGRLYIVQVRPVTAALAPRTAPSVGEGLHIISPDRIDEATPHASGFISRILARRADKHQYVRQAAQQERIPVTGEWLLTGARSTPQGIRELADTIREKTSTSCVTVALPRLPATLLFAIDLEPLLSEHMEQGDTVYASAVHVGTTSGYAALRADGSLLVEYVAGGIGGLKFGAGPFSVLVAGVDGDIITNECRPTSNWWDLRGAPLEFRPVAEPRTPQPLDTAAVAELRQITSAMSDRFGEVRIEWMRLADGSVLLWDLSIEHSTLGVDENGGPGALSPGRAAGEAVVMTDLEPLESLLDQRNVIPEPAYLERHSSGEADQLRARLLGGRARPIVVAPQPRMALSLLLGHVAGFVFDEAPLLCHLSIILREAGVPAVVQPGATRLLSTGDLLELDDGEWVRGTQPGPSVEVRR
jgi:hypothetical protein